ncbi:MAG: TRAP transporter substrate-binding protein [Treponema sp.]|nr:TRAP transporter substrate-binding protein [Candidatus Treponema equifaecale]
MKKIFAVLLLPVLAFTGCNKKTNENSNNTITFTMSEAGGPTTISSQMDQFFKEKVEELSEGQIKIDIKFGAIFGGEESVIKMMQSKNSPVQLCRVSTFSLTTFGAKKSILPTIPFTFKNREHFWKFANSQVAQELLLEPSEEKIGVRGLFFAEEGFRNFFSVYPLNSISDVKNKKIRVASDPLVIELVKALDSEPVFVTTNDIFAALQTGKTDIAEQPISAYLSSSFNTVAPNMILDGHTLGVTEIIISEEAWNSLTENQQKILNEAGKLAAEYCREIAEKVEAESIEELKKLNTNITEVQNLSEWQEAGKKVAQKYSTEYPELYEKIVKLAE